ncbi:amidase [Streptomyces sp. di188]|nr:amidase [Streptomyces sp. di50b]SCE39283.1 amidase [Streptomyces sp. di188]
MGVQHALGLLRGQMADQDVPGQTVREREQRARLPHGVGPVGERVSGPAARATLEQTPPADAAVLVRLMGAWLGVRRSWAEFLDARPLLLGPVFTEPPAEPGLESRDAAGRRRDAGGMRLCTVTSFVGVPAVAVPTGIRDGLPCGVQVVGRAFREDLCLAAAQEIEDRLGVPAPVDPRPAAAAETR